MWYLLVPFNVQHSDKQSYLRGETRDHMEDKQLSNIKTSLDVVFCDLFFNSKSPVIIPFDDSCSVARILINVPAIDKFHIDLRDSVNVHIFMVSIFSSTSHLKILTKICRS